jgi:hypothetical protein
MVRILKPDSVAIVLSGFNEVEQPLEKAQKINLIRKWRKIDKPKRTVLSVHVHGIIVAAL